MLGMRLERVLVTARVRVYLPHKEILFIASTGSLKRALAPL